MLYIVVCNGGSDLAFDICSLCDPNTEAIGFRKTMIAYLMLAGIGELECPDVFLRLQKACPQ